MLPPNDCTTAIGLDLGIRTGSLVQVMVEPDTNLLRDYRILASWRKGPSVKDPLPDIIRFFDLNILNNLTYDTIGDNQTIAIDWNPNEIYWSANKHNSNTKTFVAGYITCHCRDNYIKPVFISPDDIRAFLTGKRGKLEKGAIQRHFMSLPKRLLPEQMSELMGLTEHDMDALILAYQIDLMSRNSVCPAHLMVP